MVSSNSFHSAQKALQDDAFLMSMFRAEPETLCACLMQSVHSVLHLLVTAVQVSDLHACDRHMHDQTHEQCDAIFHMISHQHISPAAVPG